MVEKLILDGLTHRGETGNGRDCRGTGTAVQYLADGEVQRVRKRCHWGAEIGIGWGGRFDCDLNCGGGNWGGVAATRSADVPSGVFGLALVADWGHCGWRKGGGGTEICFCSKRGGRKLQRTTDDELRDYGGGRSGEVVHGGGGEWELV